MKIIRLSTLARAIVILPLIVLSSCATLKTLPNGKKIDIRLAGTWEGSEKDQQIKGVEKQWVTQRNLDGTYTIRFKASTSEETQEFQEKGDWWVENGAFYSHFEESIKPEVYKYTVVDNKQIKFVMMDAGDVDFSSNSYSFTDTKIINSPKGNQQSKNALSIENAIKVKSIEEEYTFVKDHCTGCIPLGQALIENNGKMYDVLNVKNPNGEEISYYFDISAIYGK